MRITILHGCSEKSGPYIWVFEGELTLEQACDKAGMTRRYTCKAPYYDDGTELTIAAHPPLPGDSGCEDAQWEDACESLRTLGETRWTLQVYVIHTEMNKGIEL